MTDTQNDDSYPQFSQADWDTCYRVLQVVSEDVSLVANDEQFKGLVAKINKAGRKRERQTIEQYRRQLDRAKRGTTGMVQAQIAQAQASPAQPSLLGFVGQYYNVRVSGPIDKKEFPEMLSVPVHCYICKALYKPLHFFYHLLCPSCARLNHAMRTQKADLTGRIALVTGGRIKIGYQTVLRLLRDGAKVIATTRFPHDAARRYSQEPDFAEWLDRLTIYAIDLRRPADVEAFAEHLLHTLPHLDIVINNAAQTVKRPLAWYGSLIRGESEPFATLPGTIQALFSPASAFASSPLLETHPNYPVTADMTRLEPYFPQGLFDGDGQAIDARPSNSWKLKLDQVPTVELVEVLLVNSVAPFILNARLKPLFLRSPFSQRFIVNVSAMEGQFNRESKTADHPHTNMAKAALNMLTRTSAQEYTTHKIYMTAVDTGWITDEKPLPERQWFRDQRDFYPPLDIIDGVSRIYDPIARGINYPQDEPVHGLFLKDYKPYPW